MKRTIWNFLTTALILMCLAENFVGQSKAADAPKAFADTVKGMPVGWIRTPPGDAERYSMTVDSTVRHGGSNSASVRFSNGETDGFGSLAQLIVADEYHGKRLRLSGWLKTANATEAGLWMRLDTDYRILGFDNMMTRAVKGTTDWKKYEVVLDVPPETVNIVFGILLSGTGQVWVDDIRLEVVATDVATTNMLSPAEMRSVDLDRVVTKSASKQPANPGFEDGVRP